MDQRRTDPENNVGAGDEEGESSVPASVPDPEHIRLDDAVRR